MDHKKSFQLERIILFSDAVFAIAITLLVIELKIHEPTEYSSRGLAIALLRTMPHFISFVISFMIVGIYWVAHHKMFSFVKNYDVRLLWLNLLLLFFIALMPFSSNIYGVYFDLDTSFVMYFLNISMISLFFFLTYSYISKPGKNLSEGLENPRKVQYFKARCVSVPICFGVGVLVSLLSDSAVVSFMARMAPVLIWPAMRYIGNRYSDVRE